MALHEAALALRRELGETLGIASSLNNLGGAAMEQGDYERARALWEESLALRRQAGETRAIAVGLMNLGVLAHYQGAYARSVALLEEGGVAVPSRGRRRDAGDGTERPRASVE